MLVVTTIIGSKELSLEDVAELGESGLIENLYRDGRKPTLRSDRAPRKPVAVTVFDRSQGDD